MARSWTPAQARAARLRSLLLTDHPHASAVDVVTWFGAMQAQDLASGLWSLGVRLPGSTETDLLAALEEGRILRTWPMRGTIHLVPSGDAAWMLDLMGSRVLATGPRRREQLGLTLDDVERATQALADSLAGGRRLTRAEALAVVNDAGITTEGQRGYHVLWYAAQTGVTCIGPQVEGEQTFVRLDEWAPAPRTLTPREAAAELAFRYFRSHGPTTVQDFAGWTGLPLGTCRTAIADNEGRLTAVTVGAAECWVTVDQADSEPGQPPRSPLALPGFDELMLGYKDRALHVPAGRFDDIVPGGNGMFRATVVTAGTVVGTWTRTITKATVKVTIQPFTAFSSSQQRQVERAFGRYGEYLARTPALVFAPPL